MHPLFKIFCTFKTLSQIFSGITFEHVSLLQIHTVFRQIQYSISSNTVQYIDPSSITGTFSQLEPLAVLYPASHYGVISLLFFVTRKVFGFRP